MDEQGPAKTSVGLTRPRENGATYLTDPTQWVIGVMISLFFSILSVAIIFLMR